MNSTKIISVIVLITGVLSGYAYAGVSEKFKSICNQTTANIVAGVQLKKYIADVNTNTRGIYVVSNTGVFGIFLVVGIIRIISWLVKSEELQWQPFSQTQR